ncbi:MAG: DUF3313 family protein [Candidatus Omnitrophota bacterium]
MPKHFILALFFICLIVAPVRAAEEPLVYSGFLGDYAKFKSYPHEPGVSTETHPTLDMYDYKKVMISDIEVRFAPDVDPLPLTRRQVKVLQESLRQKTRQFLSTQFDVVREPGDDVLVFRLGITDIVPHDIHTPAWDPRNPGLMISFATIETDFVVSTTGERIFAILDERASRRYQVILGSLAWWHTDDLFTQWGDVFRGIINEQYGR